MRQKWIIPAVALVAVGVVVWGCKKDATAPVISLSQAEVTEWLLEVGNAMPSVDFGVAGTKNASVSCPSGGTAQASGSVSGTTTQTWDVTYTFNACRTTGYTTGGSMRNSGNGTLSSYTDNYSGSVTVTASGGRSGTCAINFTVGWNGTTTTTSGTICGINANTILGTVSSSWRARHQPL